MRLRIIYIISNLLLAFFAFLLVILYRGQEPLIVLQELYGEFLLFLGLYLLFGLLFDKYNFKQRFGLRKTILPVIWANLAFAGAASVLLIGLGHLPVSRVLFYGTLAVTTVGELFITTLIIGFRKLKKKEFAFEGTAQPVEPETVKPPPPLRKNGKTDPYDLKKLEIIINEIGTEAFDYLKKFVSFDDSTIILSVTNPINIISLPSRNLNAIVNVESVNNHQRVNLFMETVNQKLPQNGLFIGCGETLEVRKERFLTKYPPILNYFFYFLDFLIHRIPPKLYFSQGLYFKLTSGKNRVMSRAEILGRLYSCGFSLIDESNIDGKVYFVAKKIKAPYYDNSPTYGPLVRLRRIGKDHKIIGVYKLRTMHPYSEYIQEYVFSINGTRDGDKILNDFRVTTWGKVIRKLWIDELPMLYNFLKGELKLVGVRPLSEHKFNTYPKYLQEKRVLVKPGLIPPFYADIPKTPEAFFETEDKYIDAYLAKPYRTDFEYFCKAATNILFRHVRSH